MFDLTCFQDDIISAVELSLKSHVIFLFHGVLICNRVKTRKPVLQNRISGPSMGPKQCRLSLRILLTTKLENHLVQAGWGKSINIRSCHQIESLLPLLEVVYKPKLPLQSLYLYIKRGCHTASEFDKHRVLHFASKDIK